MGVNIARAEIEGDDPATAGTDESARLTHAGALSLTAIGEHALTTTAEAGAGGSVAISPAFALAVGINQTTALLPDGAAVTSDGNLTISATHKGSTITSAKADAAGEKAGFGVGFGLTVAVDDAIARLGRDVTSGSGNAVITAHTLSDASATATASALGAKPPQAGSGEPENAEKQTGDNFGFITGKVPAKNKTNVPELPPNTTQTSGGSGISIGAALGVNVAVSRSEAEITQGTTLTMKGDTSTVTFSAANDTDAAATANASAVGKGMAEEAAKAAAASATPVIGGVTLTFKDNGAQPDTITRSSGNWTTDGFKANDTITVAGTSLNNTTTGATHTIASVSADGLVLTLDAANSLQDESVSGEALAVKKSNDPTVAVTGGQTISFADNATGAEDTRDTITRSKGSWVTDGYKQGQTIGVSGTKSNNGRYRIAEISQDGRVLILSNAATLTGVEGTSVEHATGGVKVEVIKFGVMYGNPSLGFVHEGGTSVDKITRDTGSWIEDGFTAGDVITVGGAGDNNNTYTIEKVSEKDLILADGYFLTPAGNVTNATVAMTIRSAAATTKGSPRLTLTPRSDTAAATIARDSGRWLDDGFAVGDTITVDGSTATVTAISTDGLVITLGDEDLPGKDTVQSVERKAPPARLPAAPQASAPVSPRRSTPPW